MLSLRMVAPALPLVACLSSAHLAAFHWPKALRRLYVIRDRDPAGDAAWARLTDRAASHGIELLPVTSDIGSDLNDALRTLGRSAFAAMIARQMPEGDTDRLIVAGGR